MFPSKRLLLIMLVGLVLAGCTVTLKVDEPQRPEGPFDVAILAVTDTRGELEPCG